MIEKIILGIIQGVVEWLPVSSEGVIFLVINNFFEEGVSLDSITKQALFLHFGTFLAALVYFRKDIFSIIIVLFKSLKEKNFQKFKHKKEGKIFIFLFFSTFISGVLGLIFLKFFLSYFDQIDFIINWINFFIAIFLMITGLLQIIISKQSKDKNIRNLDDLKIKDGIILGFIQAMAILPGLSRSGLTVSGLLFRRFNQNDALSMSFLMSLPLVFIANIILNIREFNFNSLNLISLFCSFIFGLLTIKLLLKIVNKINFGYFVLVFGFILLLFSAFLT